MFVYLITNTINGKRYVGQTKRTMARRWAQHCKSVGCHALSAAIKKYGPENFCIDIICEPPTKELLDEFEIEYIQRYNTLSPNGYNLRGDGGVLPWHSEETRKRMSVHRKGRVSSRKGAVLSEETKKKLSESKMGKKQPEWAVQKRRLSQIGGKRSEETKKKMSESAKRDWQKRHASGYVVSEEVKQKMSDAHKARRLNELNAVGEFRS